MRETLTYRPWAALAALPELTVAITRLPGRARSWWLPAEQAIVLDDRLTQVERRCALAHELVHAERNDEHSDVTHVGLRQEQHADRIAAERLLPIERLIWGLLWSMDEVELADELNVDVHTLRTRLANLADREADSISEAVYRIEGGLT